MWTLVEHVLDVSDGAGKGVLARDESALVAGPGARLRGGSGGAHVRYCVHHTHGIDMAPHADIKRYNLQSCKHE